MSGTEEFAVLTLLAALTLVGALLWAREGLVLWFAAAVPFCF